MIETVQRNGQGRRRLGCRHRAAPTGLHQATNSGRTKVHRISVSDGSDGHRSSRPRTTRNGHSSLPSRTQPIGRHHPAGRDGMIRPSEGTPPISPICRRCTGM